MTRSDTVSYPLDIDESHWTTIRWEDDVIAVRALAERRRFEQAPIVFYGSSSFRFWTRMAEDLDRLDVLNLGFGGATVESGLRYFDAMMDGVSARSMVLYFGENDIASDGLTAEQVHSGMSQLVERIRARFGSIPLYVVSIKHSPSRWIYAEEFERLNERLRTMCSERDGISFIDLSSCLIGHNRRPIGRYYANDQLHLNAAGYRLWADELKLVPFLWEAVAAGDAVSEMSAGCQG